MINEAVETAVNEQIKHELYSAYLYLAMSAYSERQGLPGFAHWMRLQSSEEVNHAMKLFDYVNDRGGKVLLQAIDQPPADFGSPLDIARATLEHEQKVTGLINKLYETATRSNDYATQAMLQWFVSEQVEEEKNATLLVDQLEMAGDNRSAILMLDMELGKRV